MPVPQGFGPIPLSNSIATKKNDVWFFDLPPQLKLENFSQIELKIPSAPSSDPSATMCRFNCGGTHYMLTEAPKDEHQSLTPLYPTKDESGLAIGNKFSRWFRVVEDVQAGLNKEAETIKIAGNPLKVNDQKNMQNKFLPIGYTPKDSQQVTAKNTTTKKRKTPPSGGKKVKKKSNKKEKKDKKSKKKKAK